MQRRRLVIGLMVMFVLGALAVLWQQQQNGVQVADALAQNTTTVTSGKLTARVTGAGNIYAPLQTNLNFQLTGVPITKINVKIGDRVEANTVLAQVDDYDLQFQLRTAMATLATAQARLAQLKTPPDPLNVAALKAKVDSAQSAYDAAVAKSALGVDQLMASRVTLEKARLALQNAQAAYNGVAWRGDVGMTPQATTLQQASLDYQSALSAYNLAASGINETGVKAAAQSLAQAQWDYANLTDPPTADELTISQAAVDSAQTAVDLAKRRLDQAKIIAPFDGTVAAINYVVGQIAVSGANQPPVITLVNLVTLQIQLTFSEIDITRIKMGQQVSLTFDALARKTLPGKILSISPIGIMTQGVVNYVVTVTLANPDAAVLPGMTAEAAITTDSRDNAWRVLSKAVKTQGKASTLTILREGQPIALIVQTGISDDKNTEIISATTMEGAPVALEEGEVVVINPAPPGTPTRPVDIPIRLK